MNCSTRIQVKTAVGMSKTHFTGANVGQGTVGGSIASALSLDTGFNKHFNYSDKEYYYGSQRVQPLLYQDDAARLAISVEAAQTGNNKIESIMKEKQLQLNLDKTVFMICGNNEQVNKIKDQLIESPLTMNSLLMKNVESDKYLGDMIHCGGVEASIDATIRNRHWRVTSAIMEIKSVLEDCRLSKKGGIASGLELWELGVIPMLLNNASTWYNINSETMKKINNYENDMFRILFNTPRSTPTIALWWDLGTIPIEFKIIASKLNLFHHILYLDDGELSKNILKEQISMKFPGLAMEAQQYMKDLNLPDISENSGTKISSYAWKNLVKKALKQHCEKYFLQKLPDSKKLKDNIKGEKFERKQYINEMTMKEAQTNFKFRTHMTNVKFNYKNDKKYREELWRCDSCKSAIDTQSHILWCPAYRELRIGKNINNDSDLVNYIQKVMKVREEMNVLK